MRNLQDRVRQAARESGYNAKQIADGSGMAHISIRAWWTGHRDLGLPSLLRVAAHLGVEISAEEVMEAVRNASSGRHLQEF